MNNALSFNALLHVLVLNENINYKMVKPFNLDPWFKMYFFEDVFKNTFFNIMIKKNLSYMLFIRYK